MKPVKNDQNSHDKRLQAGNLLLWPHKEGAAKSLFMVVGVTHAEVALLRVVDDQATIPAHIASMYEIRYRVKWVYEPKASSVLFVDISKFIVKKSTQVADALTKAPETHVGNIHHLDRETIAELLTSEKTISRELKDKFLWR